MSDPEETAGPPPVKATRSDPLLDEAIALLGKEVLRLKKQNSVKVKDVEVFPAAVNGLDPSAPEFLPRSQAAYLHKRPKRSISLQNPSRGQSRASTFSLGLLNRDPVLEDVIRRLEKEVARIKMEESKPARVTKFEISSATLDPFQSLVENGFNGDKSPVTSHLKVMKVRNCDEHEPEYYLPTHNPLLDDIVVMLERKVAAIKERKTPDMREVKVTENKKGEVAENKKAGVVAIKEGCLGGKRVARGDVSSLDGKSDDGKGAQMVCICLRSMKLILCRGCGGSFEGRLSKTCSAHPRATYLHDVTVCIFCRQTGRDKLQEFPMPSKEVPVEIQRNEQGIPIVEI